MTWIVFDQATVNTIKQKGTIGIVDVYSRWKNKPQSFMEFNEPVDTVALNKQQETPYDIAPFLKEGEQKGVVVSASTLAELGEKAGMDKQRFEATAKRYADMAGQNKDTDFFKDSKYLSKLNQGPFYAVKVVTRTLTTLGGVKVNQHTQAVDDNEKVIPGLWAVGSDAGGMYGNSYVMFEGGTLGFAYNSGRIAGESAAAYSALNKN
jgi:fumarate reductase flavoprotein subunit